MIRISDLLIVAVVVTFAVSTAHANILFRVRRQDSSTQNEEVIDNIFNIPITAIRQTAAAAQSFLPENSQTVDSIFQIPITTLESVGNLVKNTSPQRRRENAEEIQRRRQERRDRVLAQRERQRLQREQQQQQQRLQREQQQKQRFQREEQQKYTRHYHHDPLGLNSLANLLVGHHGIFGGHGGLGSIFGSNNNHQNPNESHGGHGGSHGGNHGGSHGGSHGGHGGHGGSHGGQGSHGGHGDNNQGSQVDNSYEVYEEVDEGDNPVGWHGWAGLSPIGLGNTFLSQASASSGKIENKIAPKDNGRREYHGYQNSDVLVDNKIAPKNSKDFSELPLESKIIAPKRPNGNRLVFESSSFR